jgi:hypothetical protein
MSVPARPSVIKSKKFIDCVRINLKLQIPPAGDGFLIYKELKQTLQE